MSDHRTFWAPCSVLATPPAPPAARLSHAVTRGNRESRQHCFYHRQLRTAHAFVGLAKAGFLCPSQPLTALE